MSKRNLRGPSSTLLKLFAMAAIATVAQSAVAGIANTRHNLGSTGTQTNHLTAGTGSGEICVFCHTPHASNQAIPAPLWNKGGGTPTTYTLYSSSTLDGANGTGTNQLGGISLACLSCHDGTQAMDNMVNAPGSGGYNLPAARMAGAVWTGARVGAATGLMTNAGTFISMLGTDLTNDHPVGIQYCGGGYSTGSAASTGASVGTCSMDADFKAPLSATIGGNTAWWVETGGNTTRSKTDIILYGRAVALAAGGVNSGFYQPFVECASCHDPHTEANPTFLRVSNVGSGVCLSCHVK
ncbi:MAG: hypothetical protein FIB06_11345 [Betaproteobacteria bacterium]|nr:hypothetical protein [Betaproteobacteria bacterium]